MRILDRYLMRFFLVSLIWCILAFVSFYIIIDLFGRLDAIIQNKTSVEVITSYYLSLIPLVFVRMCPLAVLLSTMYTLAGFSKNNEMTAAAAGGVHPRRILLPFILSGLVLSLVSMAVNEKNVPDSARKACRIKETKIKGNKEQHVWRNRIFYGSDNRKFYVKLIDTEKDSFSRIEITGYGKDGLELWKFHASKGKWVNGEWLFHDATLREFDSRGRVQSSVYAGEVKVNKAGWTFFKRGLSADDEVEAVVPRLAGIEETPGDFTRAQLKAEEMSSRELNRYIERLRGMGFNPKKELVSLHNKISLPFANLVVMLIGIPFAIRQRRGGVLIGFGNALAICLVYYLLQSIGSVLGESFLPPVVGAWFANGIFGVTGILGLLNVPHLSG